MKQTLNLLFISLLLTGCQAQEKKLSNDGQLSVVENKFCSCISSKLQEGMDWTVALPTCDDEILFSQDKDFFKLEYDLRMKFPEKNMSELVWEYKTTILKDLINNCSSFKGIIVKEKIEDFLVAYRNLTLNKATNGNFSGETYYSTRNLFAQMLSVEKNDSLICLFETKAKYLERIKEIKELNSIVSSNKDCVVNFEDKELKDGLAVFTVTPCVGKKAIAQFRLTFKENDVVFKIREFELIEKDKIVFDSSSLENTPPPPPPSF